MNKISPKSLVELLKSQQLNIRTGILLIPIEFLGSEAEIAVYLEVGHQNICELILCNALPNRGLLGVNRDFIFDNIDAIVKTESIQGRCVLISGIDLLLAALSHEEVMHFWAFLRNNYRRERGVLLSFPLVAKTLLPTDEINLWNEIERITCWEEPQNDC